MITAPMVASRIWPSVPAASTTPSCGRIQPATSAPMMPIDDVADQPEARAAHDQAGQPARDRADHECRDDTH